MKEQPVSTHGHGREPRVVVVGAGMAGVGAVGALTAAGIRDVTLLEARDRPGGRVQNVVMDDGFVELGAQFLHGKNQVYNIAEREGMLADEPSGNESLPDTLLQFRPFAFQSSDGDNVNPVIVTHNLQVLEELLAAANAAMEGKAEPDIDASVGDFFRGHYKVTMAKMMGSEEVKDAMFRWMELWECQDTGGSVQQLSLAGDAQYAFCPGNGTRVTTQGMEEVFKCLLKDSVPEGCLRLNKPVKVIHWTAGGGLNAETSRGGGEVDVEEDSSKSEERTKLYSFNNNLISSENLEEETSRLNELNAAFSIGTKPKGTSSETVVTREPSDIIFDKDTDRTKPEFSVMIECVDGDVIFADHVIVTSSIGFLRSNPDFFQPRLSEEHQKAVSSMGFGNVAKMFLLWDAEKGSFLQNCCPCLPDVATEWTQRMLGSDVAGVIPLWLDGSDTQLKSAKYSKKMENGRQWYEEVSIYHLIQSHSFCLVAWVGGEAAIIMESLPVSEVKDVLHELLTLFMDKPDLPPPCRFIRSEWHSNPYTRGAYSYLAAGVPLELHQVLSHPLPSSKDPVVQLAGEACSKHYYSTMHGALQSGQLAARAVLSRYNLAQQ
ncbi:spermine oxidase-like isoform X2 [Littorina saxatilis]